MKNPPSFEDEIKIRLALAYSILPTFSPIIVLDEIKEQKYEIKLNSHIYEDVRENLVKIG